jgi:hypothetical protein
MVEILEDKTHLVIRIDGQETAQYHFGATVWKPYLHPLRAANGLSMLDNEPTDHRHHHGLWIGHGRVDSHDFWLERHNSGKIFHRAFEAITSGEQGSFTETCDWVTREGETILSDSRTFTFYDAPVEARYFDFDLTLHAPGSAPVTLHPTNEAGLPALRLAPELTIRRGTGAALTNVEGKQEAGKPYNTYGKASPFVDASGGKLGRLTCGIAIFSHPDNPAHPPKWFTRDYGPLFANYGFFQEDPIVITPENPLRLRYRIYSHSGDFAGGRVLEAWEAYQTAYRDAASLRLSK